MNFCRFDNSEARCYSKANFSEFSSRKKPFQNISSILVDVKRILEVREHTIVLNMSAQGVHLSDFEEQAVNRSGKVAIEELNEKEQEQNDYSCPRDCEQHTNCMDCTRAQDLVRTKNSHMKGDKIFLDFFHRRHARL